MAKRKLFDEREQGYIPGIEEADKLRQCYGLSLSAREWAATRKAAKKAKQSYNSYIREAIGRAIADDRRGLIR